MCKRPWEEKSAVKYRAKSGQDEMSLAPGSSTLPDLFWDKQKGEDLKLLVK